MILPAPAPTTATTASTIAIRPAQEDEVDSIVELAQAAYRGTGGWTTEAHLVSGTRTDSSEVRAMIADPAVTLLVAVLTPSETARDDAESERPADGTVGHDHGDDATASHDHSNDRNSSDDGADSTDGTDSTDSTIVGCCYTRREPADADGLARAELGLFAVHPSAQSRGLGRRLLTAQSDHLQRAGVDLLMIRVLQSRPELHAWYERNGFVRTGVAVPFAGDPAGLQVEGLGMDVMERPLHEL